jgi:hypothetical protein
VLNARITELSIQKKDTVFIAQKNWDQIKFNQKRKLQNHRQRAKAYQKLVIDADKKQ